MREKAEEKEKQWRATNLEHKDLTRLLIIKIGARKSMQNSNTEVYGHRELQIVPSPKNWLF